MSVISLDLCNSREYIYTYLHTLEEKVDLCNKIFLLMSEYLLLKKLLAP
jgi:hypothetical protein